MSSKKSPKKNISMMSTVQNSRMHSARNFFKDKVTQTVGLDYANIPMPKDIPDWNQSASTWRHSAPQYTFAKCQRFKSVEPYSLDIIEPEIPNTKTTKYCTFGKGRRVPISEIVIKNAKEKPAPDAYHQTTFDESTRKPERGRSFGSSWHNYEKVYISHRKDVYSSHFVANNPSAKYEGTFNSMKLEKFQEKGKEPSQPMQEGKLLRKR